MFIKKPAQVLTYYCFLAVLVAGATNAYAQEPASLLTEKFNAYQRQTLQEKLYLHTDKDVYLAGELCWFRIYNTDEFFNAPIGVSKIAYVEVLDSNNKPVLQTKISLEQGKGHGTLQLPVAMHSGIYVLRAYTNWMKNFDAGYFFKKSFTIINTHTSAVLVSTRVRPGFDVQFFPEGGNLLNGIQSRIAFRAVDAGGKGIVCSGNILNSKNDSVGTFHTEVFGIGSFLLTPLQGDAYTARLVLPDSSVLTVPLPPAYSNGYAMRLTTIAGVQIRVTVHTAGSTAGIIYLLVHTRGLLKRATGVALSGDSAVFVVDTSILGDGISHFTVFNAARQPVCERLFFKQPTRHLDIAASTSQADYQPRTKIIVHVSTATGKQPLGADMSLSVYRTDSFFTAGGMDIGNYLWLTSDLAGTVESPGFYFTEDSTGKAADNLMLTQGWRRFRWDDVLQNTKPAFVFAPEYNGHFVKGKTVTNANGLPAKAVEAYLSVPSSRTQFRATVSNDSGFIEFEMPHFFGNNEVVVQAGNQGNSSVHIELSSPYSEKFTNGLADAVVLHPKISELLLNQHVAVTVENAYAGDRINRLLLPAATDTTPFYTKPDKAYLLDDYVRFTTMEEVLREYIPEVNVRKRDGRFFLPVFDNVRREFFKVEPLILLDGVAVMDADRIMKYDPLKVRKLEVVSRMYFYGNMFFNGIINFITYAGNMEGYELDPRATVIDYGTLQQEREFFSPVYQLPEQYAYRVPDFRTLLFWDPDVQTTAGGEKNVSFYASDLTGRFTIVLQGITADGKTGSCTGYFNVRKAD